MGYTIKIEKLIIPNKGNIEIKELTFGEIHDAVEYILKTGQRNWHTLLIDEKLANQVFNFSSELKLKNLTWTELEPVFDIFMRLNFIPMQQFFSNKLKTT